MGLCASGSAPVIEKIKIVPVSQEERDRVLNAMDHSDHCPGCLGVFPHDEMTKVECCNNVVCRECITGHGFGHCMVCDHRAKTSVEYGLKPTEDEDADEGTKAKAAQQRRVSTAMDANLKNLKDVDPVMLQRLNDTNAAAAPATQPPPQQQQTQQPPPQQQQNQRTPPQQPPPQQPPPQQQTQQPPPQQPPPQEEELGGFDLDDNLDDNLDDDFDVMAHLDNFDVGDLDSFDMGDMELDLDPPGDPPPTQQVVSTGRVASL